MPNPTVEDIVIPPALGSITDRVTAAADAPLVVHIADAHCDAHVQRNIAAIGRHLVEQHGFRLFAVEGTPGPINVRSHRGFYREAPEVTDQLLEAGRLTGPEWLAISHAQDLTLHGIEDEDAYRRNHQAMVAVLRDAEPARECLTRLRGALLGLPGSLEMWAHHAQLGLLVDGIGFRLMREAYLAQATALAKLDLCALVDTVTAVSKRVGDEIAVGIPVAKAVVADVLAFYATAVERDGILFRNALTAMRSYAVDRAIVVTGGFHVGGFAGMARAQGVAAVFVRPEVSWAFGNVEREAEKYKAIMAKQIS